MTPMDSEIARHPSEGSSMQWLEEHSTADVTFTPEGILIEYNSAAERMFLIPPGIDMHGENILGFFKPAERLDEAVRAVQVTGRLENWDCEYRRFDGTTLNAVVNLVGNFDTRRELRSLRAHIFNVTEWRRGHERTLFGHRVEALGRLAGGVAHDFNNLLTVIMGHAERLQRAAGDDPQRQSATAILDSSLRAATLTRQLLAFGRRQVLQPRTVNLNDLLQGVEGDIRRTFGRRIALTVDLDPAIGLVRVDPGQIEDVLDTLIAHSVAAMAGGGTLTLRTRRAEAGANRPRARYFVQPGSYVQVEMIHSGTPLDHETETRLFEPFFGDEGVRGQGLGLAAAFGVVKQSGGYIWVDSAPTATTFTLLFPLHAARAAAAPEAAAVDSRAQAVTDATILIVDDEEMVRRFVGGALRASGFTVIEAASAAECEQLAASYPDRLHLVVADVHLGHVSGPQLGERLRRQIPELRLLYISGSEDESGLADAPNTGYLQKPFPAAQIVQRVRELLAAR